MTRTDAYLLAAQSFCLGALFATLVFTHPFKRKGKRDDQPTQKA